jgi:hypothetical protein
MEERISVRVIRTTDELEDVRDNWTSWQYHPNSDIDFYLTVNRLRPQVLRPHVIVLYRDAVPTAMLVGRIEDKRLDLKVGYWNAFRLRARVINFVHAGFLGDSSDQNCQILVAEIMNSLRLGEGDVALIHSIKPDSSMYRAAARLPGFLWRDHAPTTEMHWTLRLPGSTEELFCGLSHKARKNRRQEAQKLLRDHSGNVRVVCFSKVAEVDRAASDIEEVARRTYHRGLGVGFVDTAENRERLLLEAEKGWLRAYVMYVADRPSGFLIGSLYNGTLHGNSTGYDPDLRNYSPGTFLLMKIIEESCRNSIKEIDFGSGDAWYKRMFCNHEFAEASIFLFAPNLRGLRLNALRMPTILIDRLAKKVLERLNALPRIKRAWRGYLQQRKNEPSENGESSAGLSASKARPKNA